MEDFEFESLEELNNTPLEEDLFELGIQEELSPETKKLLNQF
tara:strand:- start:6425 stop:6550 length:126 start_codon:yes stop_codon:yes gene_type:complete